MSESDKKTPIVPSDQGATSMTATVVPKELESEWLQFLKQKEEDKEYDEMVSYTNKQMSRYAEEQSRSNKSWTYTWTWTYSLVALLLRNQRLKLDTYFQQFQFSGQLVPT